MPKNPHFRRETDDGSQAELRRENNARVHARSLILDTARLLAVEILPTRSSVQALRYLAEAARELTGARYAAIGVAKSEGGGFSDLVTAGFSPAEQAAFTRSLPGESADADGILRLLLEREEPLRLKLALEEEGESFLGVPLRRGNVALGALYVTNKNHGQAFTDADEANIEALGVHATVAIHNLQALQRERALIAGLLEAHEIERRVLAYDLHDGLTQCVMAAHIHLEAFEYAQECGKTEKAALELAETSKYLQKAVVESRRMIRGLRSLTLDDLGLCAALEQLLKEEKEQAGWSEAEFKCNLRHARFDPMLETAAYRIVQEALTNARRHARARCVTVSCERQSDEESGRERLFLQVSDNGSGFDAPAHAFSLASRDGVGLFSMRERTRMLDGDFEFHSVPGEGTSLSASFPLPQTEAQTEKTPDET